MSEIKFDLNRSIKELPFVIVHLYFLSKPESIPVDKYKPVSYEYWLMLKELDYTKFGYDYDSYVNRKKELYEEEVENKKDCVGEIKNIVVMLDTRKSKTIEDAKKKIKEIESNPFFEKWLEKNLVEDVLNL